MNRHLIETQTLRMLPVRSQKETRNMLLETKGKGTLICSIRNLSRIVPAIMLTAEFISDEYKCIKEETSKYILEVSA